MALIINEIKKYEKEGVTSQKLGYFPMMRYLGYHLFFVSLGWAICGVIHAQKIESNDTVAWMPALTVRLGWNPWMYFQEQLSTAEQQISAKTREVLLHRHKIVVVEEIHLRSSPKNSAQCPLFIYEIDWPTGQVQPMEVVLPEEPHSMEIDMDRYVIALGVPGRVYFCDRMQRQLRVVDVPHHDSFLLKMFREQLYYAYPAAPASSIKGSGLLRIDPYRLRTQVLAEEDRQPVLSPLDMPEPYRIHQWFEWDDETLGVVAEMDYRPQNPGVLRLWQWDAKRWKEWYPELWQGWQGMWIWSMKKSFLFQRREADKWNEVYLWDKRREPELQTRWKTIKLPSNLERLSGLLSGDEEWFWFTAVDRNKEQTYLAGMKKESYRLLLIPLVFTNSIIPPQVDSQAVRASQVLVNNDGILLSGKEYPGASFWLIPWNNLNTYLTP